MSTTLPLPVSPPVRLAGRFDGVVGTSSSALRGFDDERARRLQLCLDACTTAGCRIFCAKKAEVISTRVDGHVTKKSGRLVEHRTTLTRRNDSHVATLTDRQDDHAERPKQVMRSRMLDFFGEASAYTKATTHLPPAARCAVRCARQPASRRPARRRA